MPAEPTGGDASNARKPARNRKAGCAFAFLLIGTAIVWIRALPAYHEDAFYKDDAPAVVEAKRNGEELAGALRKYRAVKKVYPKVLQDLVPEYLPAIPEPRLGAGRWVYKNFDEEFEFYVSSGTLPGRLVTYPNLSYSSKHRSEPWVLDR